ncbi:MAG: AAA family ATPase [Caldilinea sp.]|nr:AAA family ATPase [Caldilinea sp.]MDW8442767.1 AAA family ATPase [Caldilineaceae bacterium]
MDTLRGVVERITFHNEETGYTVAKLTPEATARTLFGAAREVTIVGTMLGLNVGECVELTGRWTVHSDHGRRFQVETFRPVLPATIAGLEKYLGSGLIKGVGPVTAHRIVKQFGLATLTIIEEQPERLIEAPGVGPKRVEMIRKAWAEQRAIKEVMLFLQSHGVSTGLATKIYKTYGDDALQIVRSDPYRLAREIFGVGFLTADKIARSLGMPEDAPERVAAGVAYALNQASEEGHVFLPTSELVKLTAELLHVSPSLIGLGLARMWNEGQVKVAPGPGSEAIEPQPTFVAEPKLVAEQGQLYAVHTVEEAQRLLAEENAVYLTPLYFSEIGAARRLRRLLSEGESRLAVFAQYRPDDWSRALAAVELGNGFPLAPQQRQAVRVALTHRVSVLTGGPGTGKTTTVRTLLELCRREGKRVLLAAPTGRAAKRLMETTGYEAKTIHRLLEFKPGEGLTFQRHEENPLEGDLLIVDEASMLDLPLSHHLFKAIPPGMHLLLVGDVDQLPSVGAGNVLKDVIAALESQENPGVRAAVIRLQTIFRQEAGSLIITNAHRINAGQMPVIDNQAATDFFLFRTEAPERAAELCVELVTERIPRRFGIPPEEIQVLAPMHRGVAGVAALNAALQKALNPPTAERPERTVGSRVYRVGDKVMQVRNNYDKDVYNGDIGRIVALDPVMHTLTVVFNGRPVRYEFLELDELIHAYAVSVHKSQGSEFTAVVIPILTSHYMMLQRNLLYTAVTRARRLVVLVGQPRAIALAVNNNAVTTRYTGLKERLLAESAFIKSS